MNINDLPLEILLHIFVAGCNEPDDPQELVDYDGLAWFNPFAPVYPHPRRRKSFAALLRRVCVSWRNIIEDLPNIRSPFHVIRVALDRGSPMALPRQLSKTKKFLASSNGCDVIAKFSCYDVTKNIEELSPEEEKLVRIFIHGMYTIVPFQRQLIGLELFSTQPQICKHFSEILMGLESTPRLRRLSFYNPYGQLQVASLSAISPAPGFSPLLCRRESKMTLPLSSRCFRWLDTLMVNDFNWFAQMQIPTRPSRLFAVISHGSNEIFRILCALPSLASTLTSLIIQSDGLDMKRPSSGQDKETYDTINLPHLRYLRLQGDCPTWWAHRFLRHIRFPCLRKVHLNVDSFSASEGPAPSSWEAKDILHFPSLSFLSVELATNSSNLELMDIFSYSPIKTLDVRVFEEVDSGSELMARLKQTLSRFQPEIVRFDFYFTTDLLQLWELILGNINLSMLRVLTFDLNLFMGSLKGSPQSRAFVLPALEEVHIYRVSLSGLAHILSSLDGNSFKLISVRDFSESAIDLNAGENRESLETLGVLSFPSIVSATCSLQPRQVSFIGVFSRLVPNAQHLHFTFDLRNSESTSPGVQERLSLCKRLEPQDGNLLFPHVTSMEGVFILRNECQFFESVCETFTHLFRLRNNAGAPLLVVQDVTTGPRQPDRPDGRKFGWEVKFRAGEGVRA
jgi:hypothetical protein